MIWDTLKATFVQQRTAPCFNAYHTLLSTQLDASESLDSLINKVDEQIRVIKSLSPSSFTLDNLYDELAVMAIIMVLPHSFDDVVRTISVLDKFDKQSVIQSVRNIDQTRSNLSHTLLPFLLHQHLPDHALRWHTKSPSPLHPLLPPLTLPPVLQAAPFASFAPLLVMLRPNASLSSISCILTLHCHFTVCIEQDTMHFIRDNKIAFQAKTGEPQPLLSSLGGHHSCGRICLPLVCNHPPFELGPLASLPLPPPLGRHQEATIRQPGDGFYA